MSHDSNPELEREVLACVLTGSSAERWAIMQGVLPHALCFSDQKHRLVYLAMERASEEGQAPDVMTVFNVAMSTPYQWAVDALMRLTRVEAEVRLWKLTPHQIKTLRGRFEGAGSPDDSMLAAIGTDTLATIERSYATAANFERHCKRVAEYYRQRIVKRSIEQVTRELEKPDAVDRIGELCTRLTETCQEVTRPDGEVCLAEVAIQRLESIEPPSVEAGSWGVPGLDKACLLRRNAMCVLAAPPGCGKTSLAIQAARSTAQSSGYAPGAVAIVSLEMDRDEISDLLMAQALQVPVSKIEHNMWSQAEKSKAFEDVKKWRDSIHLHDEMVSTGRQIAQWARSWKRRNPEFRLLIVDHLNVLGGSDPRSKEYETISENTKVFYRLRKELNICILCLCQLNREGRKDKPTLAALRGSGSIEQDASSVLFLHSEEAIGETRTVHAIIAKNRRGATGVTPLTFHAASGQRFTQGHRPMDQVNPDGSKTLAREPDDSEDLFS